MERRNITEAETKLVILYTIDRLGPVTGLQLLQFLVDNDLMNYFTMQINLTELTEQGQIAQLPHPLGTLLRISESGAYTLSTFGHRIPASKRELIDARSPDAHRAFRADQQTPAETINDAEGACIRLLLMENSAPLMDILMRLPQGCSLPFLQKRWRHASQRIYDAVTQALTGSYDTAAPLAALPDGVSLNRDESGNWMLLLADDAADPSFTLQLSLPDEHLAHSCACAWPARCDALRRVILRELQEATAACPTEKP